MRIAGAVTAYGHQREQDLAHEGTERLGVLVHELRNLLNTAILSFDVIKRGHGRARRQHWCHPFAKLVATSRARETFTRGSSAGSGRAEARARGVERDRSGLGLGLGLGLSIALSAVHANAGELHVRDIPGQGCVFTIDLPRDTHQPAASFRPSAHA